jgi:hypothetical protein
MEKFAIIRSMDASASNHTPITFQAANPRAKRTETGRQGGGYPSMGSVAAKFCGSNQLSGVLRGHSVKARAGTRRGIIFTERGHDYGNYRKVNCEFDPNNSFPVKYAYRFEEHAPTTWEEVGLSAEQVQRNTWNMRFGTQRRALGYFDRAGNPTLIGAEESSAR